MQADTYTYAHSNTDSNSHAYSNAYSNAYSDPNTNTNTNSNSYSYSYSDSDPYTYTYTNAYSNSHANANSNTYSNPHANAHTDTAEDYHDKPAERCCGELLQRHDCSRWRQSALCVFDYWRLSACGPLAECRRCTLRHAIRLRHRQHHRPGEGFQHARSDRDGEFLFHDFG